MVAQERCIFPPPSRPLAPVRRMRYLLTRVSCIAVLPVTISQRRVENCSYGVQFGSQSRDELRSCGIEPRRQHCLHDPLPRLCVASPLTRNTGKPLGQATYPLYLLVVVSSMGLINPDTTNSSREAGRGRGETLACIIARDNRCCKRRSSFYRHAIDSDHY